MGLWRAAEEFSSLITGAGGIPANVCVRAKDPLNVRLLLSRLCPAGVNCSKQ